MEISSAFRRLEVSYEWTDVLGHVSPKKFSKSREIYSITELEERKISFSFERSRVVYYLLT